MSHTRIKRIIADHDSKAHSARILRDWPKEHLHKKQAYLWKIRLRQLEQDKREGRL